MTKTNSHKCLDKNGILLTEKNQELLDDIILALKTIGIKTDKTQIVNLILHLQQNEIKSALNNLMYPNRIGIISRGNSI